MSCALQQIIIEAYGERLWVSDVPKVRNNAASASMNYAGGSGGGVEFREHLRFTNHADDDANSSLRNLIYAAYVHSYNNQNEPESMARKRYVRNFSHGQQTAMNATIRLPSDVDVCSHCRTPDVRSGRWSCFYPPL